MATLNAGDAQKDNQRIAEKIKTFWEALGWPV